jgi:L-ascorbate metabolism protein UlaG (beta-lactamase superfamily)
MNIQWHGQSCFQIIARREKNSPISIVIDPFDESLGLKVPKLEADILLITHSHRDHNNVKAVSATTSGSSPFLISGPGEYEVKEVYIQGIHSWHDEREGKERGENTIYTIEAEDLKLCHLGDFGQKELTEEQLEKIGEVDVLMIPVGGVYTISAKEAIRVMSQIEPKIIIPMHYQIPSFRRAKAKVEKKETSSTPKLNPPAGGKLEGVDKFLKVVGIKSIVPESKLSIKKKDIFGEEVKIVVLEP